MKKISLVLVLSFIFSTSCNTLKGIVGEPTALETITALRDILNSSTLRTISDLQKLNNGDVSSLLPEEIRPVLAGLNTLGLGGEVEKITKSIGVASGLAMKESGSIINDAIKQLDFNDAVAVVIGGEDAATQVLRQAMYATVKQRYSSLLNAEFEKNDVNKYWPLAAGAYNMFSKNKVDSNLSDFAAERAVDVLFLSIGKEEKNIRTDYKSLGKQAVTKVFDYYTKKS
jgi:hypothetical protein